MLVSFAWWTLSLHFACSAALTSFLSRQLSLHWTTAQEEQITRNILASWQVQGSMHSEVKKVLEVAKRKKRNERVVRLVDAAARGDVSEVATAVCYSLLLLCPARRLCEAYAAATAKCFRSGTAASCKLLLQCTAACVPHHLACLCQEMEHHAGYLSWTSISCLPAPSFVETSCPFNPEMPSSNCTLFCDHLCKVSIQAAAVKLAPVCKWHRLNYTCGHAGEFHAEWQ